MVLIYSIFVFLILRFAVTLFNFISNPKLPNAGRHYTDLVSILIPVSHNHFGLRQLLKSINEQDYEHFEVLIFDDSDSFTEQLGQFPSLKFRMIKQAELPPGWTRKNYACHQLSHEAKGKYYLFLDGNTTIARGTINNCLHRMKSGRLALFSLFPNMVMKSFGERLIAPLINYLLLNLMPLRLVRLSESSIFSTASDKFMLFDAEQYQDYQWHQQLKNRPVAEIEIMRLVKNHGFNGETLLANGFAYCRMYEGFMDGVKNYSNRLMSIFGNNLIALLFYLFLVVLGPLAVVFYLDLELLFFAISLIVLTRTMISFASGQNPWLNVLLHPLQMAVLVLISVLSIQKHFIKPIKKKPKAIL